MIKNQKGPACRFTRRGGQTGFAPIWIILLIFLLGGVFLAKGNLLTSKNNSSAKNSPVTISSATPKTSSESAKVKQVSLYSFCKLEIQKLPKLPFTYETIITTGSSAEQYRKDRIKGKKDMETYATCGLNYSTIKVIEQTYASLGLQYYSYIKNVGRVWNTKDISQFPANLDNVYGEILKKEGWVRQTKEGGERLGSGLPTLIYYKDMGDKDYYIDVVVGPDPATLYLLIVKK